MTKMMMILAAQVLSVSAMADASFTKMVNNGALAQQYRNSTICTITSNLVKIVIAGPMINPRPILKQAQFTNDVPNETVAESLANEAALAALTNRPGPIGGAVTAYSALVNGQKVNLLTLSGGVVIQSNTSAAATHLKQFIDKNCR